MWTIPGGSEGQQVQAECSFSHADHHEMDCLREYANHADDLDWI